MKIILVILSLTLFEAVIADPNFDMRHLDLGNNVTCLVEFTKEYNRCIEPLPKDLGDKDLTSYELKEKCHYYRLLNDCIQERFPPLVKLDECESANATQIIDFCNTFKNELEKLNCGNFSFGINASFSMIITIILFGLFIVPNY